MSYAFELTLKPGLPQGVSSVAYVMGVLSLPFSLCNHA
jgi:hypothetical protein